MIQRATLLKAGNTGTSYARFYFWHNQFQTKFLENDCHFPLRHLHQQERGANQSPLGQERNLIAFFSSSTTSLTSQPSRSQSYSKGRVQNISKKLRQFPFGVKPHPHPRAPNSIFDFKFLTNRPLRSQSDLMLNERDVAEKITMKNGNIHHLQQF